MTCHILCVEDSEEAVLVIRRILAECTQIRADQHLHVVSDGEMALRFLRKEAPFQDAPRPTMLLLDLHLPGGPSGLDVLRYVKQTPELSTIPVLVLTASESLQDRSKVAQFTAEGYFVKPASFAELRKIAHELDAFWEAFLDRETQGAMPWEQGASVETVAAVLRHMTSGGSVMEVMANYGVAPGVAAGWYRRLGGLARAWLAMELRPGQRSDAPRPKPRLSS